MEVRARITALNGSISDIIIALPCPYYRSYEYYRDLPNGQWNGKFTSHANTQHALTNMVTGGWAYPLKYPHECPPACSLVIPPMSSPICQCILVLAEDGNRFWDDYFSQRGFTRVAGSGIIPGYGVPDLSMNCHGYSTGVGYWLDDFDTLTKYDYTRYYYPFQLADGAV